MIIILLNYVSCTSGIPQMSGEILNEITLKVVSKCCFGLNLQKLNVKKIIIITSKLIISASYADLCVSMYAIYQYWLSLCVFVNS